MPPKKGEDRGSVKKQVVKDTIADKSKSEAAAIAKAAAVAKARQRANAGRELSRATQQLAKDDYGYTGSDQRGRVPEKIERRPPRDKSGERVQQLLQQLSTKLLVAFPKVVRDRCHEFEVQCLYIPALPPLLLFSSNKRNTVEWLAATYKSLCDVAIAQVKPEIESERRKFSKLQKVAESAPASDEDTGYLEGSRAAHIIGDEGPDSDIGYLVATVQDATPWKTASIDGAAGAIAGGGGGVYVVTPQGDTHAELTLVLALAKSGTASGKSYLQGSKRPCTGCWLATSYAKEKLDLELESGALPGKLFGQGPMLGLVDIAVVRKDVGENEWGQFTQGIKDWIRAKFCGEVHVSLIDGGDNPGHDSDSDSGDESS